MFKTRLLSGIVLVIILIATVGTGGGLLFGFLALISLIGLSELYKVVDVQNKILGLTGYLGAVVYYGILYTGQMQYVTLLTIAFLVVLMAVYVFSFPTFKAEQVMTVFFGVFYVAVMLSYVYQTRMLEDGAVAVWLIFLSSWGCDTCAYCAGMLLGKHKMAPKQQPYYRYLLLFLCSLYLSLYLSLSLSLYGHCPHCCPRCCLHTLGEVVCGGFHAEGASAQSSLFHCRQCLSSWPKREHHLCPHKLDRFAYRLPKQHGQLPTRTICIRAEFFLHHKE